MKTITQHLKYADLFPEEAKATAQRLHLKKEDIPFVRKFFVADKSDIQPGERAVISYISTGVKDRDGERLMPDGAVLENYRTNPVVLYAHDYKSIPVAKNIWIKQDGKGLVAKTAFGKSAFSDELYHAYTDDVEGTGPLLKAWSVGFIPLEYEDVETKGGKPTRTYKKWELLEYSAVPIPSCPEALTLAVAKGLLPELLRKDIEESIEVVETNIIEKLETEEMIEVDTEIKAEEPVRAVEPETKAEPESQPEVEKAFTEDIIQVPVEIADQMVTLAEQNGMLKAEIEFMKAGRTLSAKTREMLKACIEALQALLDGADAPKPEPEAPKAVVVPTTEIEVETKAAPQDDKLADILGFLKSADFQRLVQDSVALSLDKLRGKVR
jgi:hypothetical protein